MSAEALEPDVDADPWIFAYGSLMWRPGFDVVERQRASVHGYHRSLCIYSYVHRGTPERPGLVLGLDRGGECRGIALRMDRGTQQATLEYLRARELVTSVYLEVRLPIVMIDGRSILATAFVVDRSHAQYAGRLSRERLLTLVRQGVGGYGDNAEYVRMTHEHLVELGIPDADLAWLADQLSWIPGFYQA